MSSWVRPITSPSKTVDQPRVASAESEHADAIAIAIRGSLID